MGLSSLGGVFSVVVPVAETAEVSLQCTSVRSCTFSSAGYLQAFTDIEPICKCLSYLGIFSQKDNLKAYKVHIHGLSNLSLLQTHKQYGKFKKNEF